MRLNDLLDESVTFKNGENAETTCEYLKDCGIPFDKKPREDGTGADFSMRNIRTAKKAFKELMQHKKICKNFDLVLEKGSNTIKVYFK